MLSCAFRSTATRSVARRFLVQQPNILSRALSSNVINLSDKEALDKFTMAHPKSVVYFTAQWCGPCKMIKPVYEEMSTKYNQVKFGKVDIDENPESAEEYTIRAVPSFLFFEGSDMTTDRVTGADVALLDQMTKELDER